MKAWLIQIDAYDGATATTLRMASHDDDRLCHLDGQTWWPVIAKLPTLRYDFFDGSFDGGSITSPSGTLEANIEAIPSLPRLAIHDARIRIWGGELGDAFSSFVLTFDGRVKEQPSVDGGAMSISFGNASGPVAPFAPGILGPKGSLYVTRQTLFTHITSRERTQAMADELFAVVGSGDVKIRIDQRFALTDVQAAHRSLEARQTTGCTILLP